MIRSRPRRSRPRVGAFAYAGLCLATAAIGWVSVITIVPAVRANSPTTSPAAVVRSAPPALLSAGSPGTAASPATPTTTPLPVPAATPLASPTKAPFQIDVYRPGTFVSQMNCDYCMAGAVQNMVNIIGPDIDLSTTRQQQIGSLLVSLTTREDSFNGGFGPAGWALAMPQLGAGTYKLVIDPTFDSAMHDAALALSRTLRPVGLLTWWGAHSWVMTGFKADSDPLLFPDTFQLKGAFIVDPFYPRVSSIWGQTLGPDTFRDMTAMAHNYIGWKRPEGHYPDRDGKWLLVIPIDG